jgi:hypothetical protein
MGITVNLAAAKTITKERLRNERKPLLETQDILFQRALETSASTTAIVAMNDLVNTFLLGMLNTRVTIVEVQMEERWKEAILRIKRIEFIMITGAGAVIVLLAGIAWKI